MSSTADQVQEIHQWIKENKYPTKIPFGPDVLLTGSVMFYLFMEDERPKKRKSSWTPNNMNLACSPSGYDKVEEYLTGLKYYTEEVENPGHEGDCFSNVQITDFVKGNRAIRVYYSDTMSAVDIIQLFEFEVTRRKYFDGTNVIDLPRQDPTASYKPQYHPGGLWDFSHCSCGDEDDDEMCPSCVQQTKKFVKYARRGVTSSVRFDADLTIKESKE